TVVFDSRAGGGTAPSATVYPGVRVQLAKGDADAAILETVRTSRSPRDLLVVTSDRRLSASARDLGARTEDADRFRARAGKRGARRARGDAPDQPDKAEKPASLSASEVDEWMRLFSVPR